MFEGLIVGTYLPGNSPLHLLDSRTKLISLFGLIILLFLKTTYLSTLIAITFLIFCIVVGKIPISNFLKGLKPILFFAILTLFLHLFFTPGVPIFKFKKIIITAEGFQKGILMSTRLLLIISYSTLVTLTTTPISLTDAFERLFSPLKKIGLPVTEFAMMISIALRFLPILAFEADKIIKAQISRGANPHEGNLFKRSFFLVSITVPLLISTFKRAEEIAVAMDARCFRGGNRVKMKKESFSKIDLVALLILLIYSSLILCIS